MSLAATGGASQVVFVPPRLTGSRGAYVICVPMAAAPGAAGEKRCATKSEAARTLIRRFGSLVRRPKRSLAIQPRSKRRFCDFASASDNQNAKSEKAVFVRSETACLLLSTPLRQSASASKGDCGSRVTIMATSTPTLHASMRSRARRLDSMRAPPMVSGALKDHSSGMEKGRRVATSFGPAPTPMSLRRARPVASRPTRTKSALSERCGRPRRWR